MEQPDPRTGLAEQRTGLARLRVQLAPERTTLAWIRTTLAMASFGFGIVGFFRALKFQTHTPDAADLHQQALQFGYGLLGLGILATFMCAADHYRSLRALKRGSMPQSGNWSLGMLLAFLLATAGVVAFYRLAVSR